MDLLLYWASLLASPAMWPKRSLMNEFMMLMALEETPVSGCTCLRTLPDFLAAFPEVLGGMVTGLVVQYN